MLQAYLFIYREGGALGFQSCTISTTQDCFQIATAPCQTPSLPLSSERSSFKAARRRYEMQKQCLVCGSGSAWWCFCLSLSCLLPQKAVCLHPPPLCHSTSPQWAQSASLARPAPCCAPALDKLLPGPWVEAFVWSHGVCECVCLWVLVCIAFRAHGEKGVLSVPKGCPPTHPHRAPYWDLREREQSLQNQRAKSSCYTSPIFSAGPTSLLRSASPTPTPAPQPHSSEVDGLR